MLLHEETYRPGDGRNRARLSRHYYDLWCLIRKGVAGRAAQDSELFRRAAEHRELFFRWTWMDYSESQREEVSTLLEVHLQSPSEF
jgi:hypothetical protein